MANILPPEYQFGDLLSQGVGTGFSNVLSGLSEGLAKRDLSQKFEKAGFPSLLAYLSPQERGAFLKQYGAAQQLAQQQQAETQKQNFIENLKSSEISEPIAKASKNEFKSFEGLENIEGMDEDMQEAPDIKGATLPEEAIYTRESRLVKENENLEKALQDPRLKSRAADIRAEIESNEGKLQKIREYRDKKFGKQLGEHRQDYLAAKEFSQDLNRLKELEDEGLTSNKLEAFLDGIGINIPALRNPNSEEFQKIVANQTRNIRQYFGGRISNLELEKFLETLPSLMNSPEGRKRIVSQLQRINDMKIASYDTAKKIIKANKGIAPDDLWDRVDDKLEKRRDEIAKRFKQELKRKVPEGESRLGIAASNLAGQALGAIPSTLKGVGKGALFGAGIGLRGGPVGVGSGAAIGSLAGLLGLI